MEQIMKAQNYSHQLDQYATIEPLGATTIKAWHKGTGKIVVIKVSALDQECSSGEQQAELSLEGHLESIKQKCLVKLYEHFVYLNCMHIIRPFYNRGSLLEFMINSTIKVLTEDEIVEKAKYIL